jgi:hypothetical protein
MAPIATLTVRLSAQIAEFQSEFRNATKEAQKFADGFEGIATRAAAIGTLIGNVATKIASSLASAFAGAVKDAVRLSSEFSNALLGLSSVARAFGTDADTAKDAAKRLSSDGLLPLKDSATGLKNLLATGFSLDQSVQLMNAFKDAAAFGRQGALSFGDAIRSATEGVKNGNSILVDNAGITKNLSQILKEAGFSAQDLSKASSDAGVRLALFNGILKESAAFTGDAARLTETYSGQISRLDTSYNNLLSTLGTAITQNATVARTLGAISDALFDLNQQLVNNRNAFSLISEGVIILVRAFSTLLNVADLIQTGFAGLQIASNRLFEAFANIGIAIFKFTERAEQIQKVLDPTRFRQHAAAAEEARQAYTFLEGAAQGLRDASRDAQNRSIALGNALQTVRAKADALAKDLEQTKGKIVEFGESGRTAGRAYGDGIEGGSKKAVEALKKIQAAIKDSLSGLKIGFPGALPGLKVDLSKLLDFIPPSPAPIKAAIVQGFEGVKNLPGIKVDIGDLLPKPPPETFWQSTFGGVKGAAQIAAAAVVDAFQRGFTSIKDFATQMLEGVAAGFIDAFLSKIPVVGEFLKGLGKPIVDFFSNLLDRNKGRDLIEDFIAGFGGNTAFRDRLNRELGGFNAEALFAQIARVGRNNQRQAQDAIDAVTAALERAEQAWGNLSSTINDRAAVFGRVLDGIKTQFAEFSLPDDDQLFGGLAAAIKEATRDGDQELAAGLAQMQATARDKIATLQPEFDRISDFAFAAFSGLVRHGTNAIDALKELEPTLKILSDGMNTFGLVGNDAIQKLLGIRDFVTANQAAFDAINADQQILSAFNDTGVLTRDLFQSLATDIGAQFQHIADNGGDMAQALALSQPVLQALWEGQRTYGAITDESTAAILRQAEEQGLVGEHMRDVNERILDVLLAIGDALGAVIPDGLRRTGQVAGDTAKGIRQGFADARDGMIRDFEASADGFRRAFRDIRPDPIHVPVLFEAGDFPTTGATSVSVPALASGGIVRRPTLALVGEAGPEAVVPLSSGGFALSTPDEATTTIILELDSRQVAEAVVPQIPGVVRRYGLV